MFKHENRKKMHRDKLASNYCFRREVGVIFSFATSYDELYLQPADLADTAWEIRVMLLDTFPVSNSTFE